MTGNPRCFSEPFTVRVIPMSKTEQEAIRKRIEELDQRLNELKTEYDCKFNKRECLIAGLPNPRPI
jgi:tetrahydromethanopterin S-methyltransferase subunit G